MPLTTLFGVSCRDNFSCFSTFLPPCLEVFHGVGCRFLGLQGQAHGGQQHHYNCTLLLDERTYAKVENYPGEKVKQQVEKMKKLKKAEAS